MNIAASGSQLKMIRERLSVKNNWTIRETKKSDAQAIFSLLFVSWLDTYVNNKIGVTEEFIIESEIHRLTYDFYKNGCKYEYFENTKDNMHLVAIDDNDIIVGFVHCRREGGKQYLNGLYLYPEFKGSGLAQDFAKIFLEWENKEMNTELGVVEYNARAITFYERLGFEPNGVKYMVKEKITCIDMVKKNIESKKV